MPKQLLACAVFFYLLSVSSFATQDSTKTTFSFWSRMTMGQVVSSTLLEYDYSQPTMSIYDVPFEKEWLETFDAGIKVKREFSSKLSGRLNLGIMINAAMVTKDITPEYSVKGRLSPFLLDAALEYKKPGFLIENDTFVTEFGYFPFKYNPQSTNLGEYLFRSGTYPGWLVSGFEKSIERPKVAGVHFSHTFGSDIKLKQDLVINTELEVYPLHDINLTYIATPSIGRFADIGLGVQFARIIPFDAKRTTIGLDPIFQDKAKPKYDPKIGYIDTAANDTILYTFRGTKLMGRFTLDFKSLIGDANGFFGTEDLKLYGEATLLGVKNYPGWYSERKQRIPMMAGINWPTNQLLSYCVIPGVMAYLLEPVKSNRIGKTAGFGAAGIVTGVGTWLMDRVFKTNSKLDLISIEVEYYPSPYSNDQDNIWKQGSPVPYAARSRSIPRYDSYWNDSLSHAEDGIKWSIYINKKLGSHLKLSAQAACDHSQKIWYLPGLATSLRYNEITPKPENWYFMMRASVLF
jgi:hypothetical protein